jgi:hypothetical protein
VVFVSRRKAGRARAAQPPFHQTGSVWRGFGGVVKKR